MGRRRERRRRVADLGRSSAGGGGAGGRRSVARPLWLRGGGRSTGRGCASSRRAD